MSRLNIGSNPNLDSKFKFSFRENTVKKVKKVSSKILIPDYCEMLIKIRVKKKKKKPYLSNHSLPI